jgi:hypothetical protein
MSGGYDYRNVDTGATDFAHASERGNNRAVLRPL